MADAPLYLDSNSDTGAGLVRGSSTSTPRSVYVFGIIVIVLVFVIQQLSGDGPGGHSP